MGDRAARAAGGGGRLTKPPRGRPGGVRYARSVPGAPAPAARGAARMADQAELKDTVERPKGASDAKPRLHAVEPVSEVATAAADAARSAVDGVSEATGRLAG